MTSPNRTLMLIGTVFGVLGVIMAAIAGHAFPGSTLGPGSQFLMIHAAALVGLAIALETGLVAEQFGRIGAYLLLGGTALFSGDMAMRAFLHMPLFPLAAPLGGFAMIFGWLLFGWAILTAPRKPKGDDA